MKNTGVKEALHLSCVTVDFDGKPSRIVACTFALLARLAALDRYDRIK